MAEVSIGVGGRAFTVTCAPGEEPQLQRAAALLDTHAETLVASGARLPDARLLLLAGLMLADQTLEAGAEVDAINAERDALLGEVEKLRAMVAELEPAAGRADEMTAKEGDAMGALERMTLRVEDLAGRAPG